MPGPGISGWSTSSSVLHAANRSSLLYQWHFWTAASNVFQVIIVKEENCSICTVPPRGQGKYQQAQNLKITKNTWAGLIQVIFYLRWKKYGKLSTVNEPSWPSVNWYKSVLSRKKNDSMQWVMLSGKYWDVLEIVCCPKNSDLGTHVKLVLVEWANETLGS